MAETGKDVKKARQLLEGGHLVAIPTETVYGLAANALDVAAVASIFEVKNRPQFDPLIVHVPDIHAADRYVSSMPDGARILAERCWPGPLTLLLPRTEIIPDLVTSGLDTVGLRCPDHALTLELLRSLNFPLSAPSANPFGYVSPTTPQHVADQLGEKIPYILDGGPCAVGIESTIVGFEDNAPVIYRLGGLSVEKIESFIGAVRIEINSTSNPRAPGQLRSHYAPRKKVIIGEIEALLKQYPAARSGVLSFDKDFEVPHQYILSRIGSLEQAAQQLFTALRTLDARPVDVILTELLPNVGLGRAINDRLQRAAAG